LAQRLSVRRYSFRFLLPALLALTYLSSTLPGFAVTPAASAPQAAEAGMPVLENFSTKDYNGSNQQFWTILQDHRGLMYFGSSGSNILEYDGVTWRKIFTPGSVIRSLVEDNQGRIWVGGAENFGYLAPDAAGTLHYVSLLDKVPADRRTFTDVWQILITPQGVFFRCYEMIFRWDGKEMHSWLPSAPKSLFQGIAAVHGHIYTAQTGVGLQEIVGDELRAVPGGEGYLGAAKLFLHPYDENRILVTSRTAGISLYDGQKAVPFPTEADDYFKLHKIYTSTLLKDGAICVTTLDGGAVILEHDGRIRQTIDQADGLANSNAISAYEDREGALWLGLGTGISRDSKVPFM